MSPIFLALLSNKYVGIGLVALVSIILLSILGIFIPFFPVLIMAIIAFVLAYVFKGTTVFKGKNYLITLRTVFAVTGILLTVLFVFGNTISSLTASIASVASIGSVSSLPLNKTTEGSPLSIQELALILGVTVSIASFAIQSKQLKLIEKSKRGRK